MKKEIKNEVKLFNAEFWSKFTDHEILLALGFAMKPFSEGKAITPRDFKVAEIYIKTHRGFKESLREEAAKLEKLNSKKHGQ